MTTIPIHGFWALYGAGPDGFVINTALCSDYPAIAAGFGDDLPYRVGDDPTNGTISIGDIIRSQKNPENTPNLIPAS